MNYNILQTASKVLTRPSSPRPVAIPTELSNQAPIQWVLGPISNGWSDQGVKLSIRLHLVPTSRMVEL
jgi:hypothetical protein